MYNTSLTYTILLISNGSHSSIKWKYLKRLLLRDSYVMKITGMNWLLLSFPRNTRQTILQTILH